MYWNRGELSYLSGSLAVFLTDFRRAVALSHRLGGWPRLAETWRGEACLWIGAWQEGRQAVGPNAEDADQTGAPRLADGLLAWMEGEHTQALRLLQAAAIDARKRADWQDVVKTLSFLSDGALQLGRHAHAIAAAREAADVIRAHEYWGAVGYAFGVLAEAAVLAKSTDAEHTIFEASSRVDATQHELARPQLDRARGLYLRGRGDLDEALAAFVASADTARAQGARVQLARTLAALAEAARARGDVTLAAGADMQRAEIVSQIGPELRGLQWARGVPLMSEGRVAGRPTGLLSRREREVAILVARGHTNRQIGETLVISPRTAGNHVEHILNKLRLQSRTQLASWAVEHGLVAADH